MMTSPTRRRFNLAGWRKRKARRTDPPTSHAAVATVTEASLGAKCAAVLGAIEDLGRRACDHELVEYYLSQVGDNAAFPPQTPSGSCSPLRARNSSH